MNKFYIFFTSAMLFTLSLAAQTNLIPFGSAWKYLDNGSNQSTAWRAISFNDGTWKTGNGKFGYGITDAATTISYGSKASLKYITTYFRKTITIADAAAYTYYTASIKRDDGAVVYVNGVEVFRNNMPTGTISYTTKASNATDNGTANQTFNIKASAFVSGTNVIAVEIHQDKTNTPDMAFDLAIDGNSDLTAPAVVSSNRQSPTATATSATTVTYRVTFSEKVTGVDATDFTVTTVTGSVSGTVASNGVAAVGTTGSIYDITVSSITGEGTLRLDLNPTGTGIADVAGNTISGGYTGGQTYTIQAADLTAPLVVSSNRQSPTTTATSATTVTYRVTFSEKVNGVDAADFTVTKVSGTVTGTVATNGVAAVGTNGDTYDVTVSSITGTGDLRLDLNSTGTGITDASGNAVSGGYTGGQTYTIQTADVTAPAVISINRQSPATATTTATSVTYRVTFSEKVNGVDAADFTVTKVSGTVSGTIATNDVTAIGTNGDTYDVTVSSITGTGDLRLDLKPTGTGITDASGNAVSGGYTSGQTYTIQAASLTPQSLLFNSTNKSYVNLTNNDAALHLTKFTLEAWVKPAGGGATTTTGTGGITAVPIISKGRSEADAPANINVNYFLGIDANKKLTADFEEGVGTNRPVVSVTSITDNVWTHVAATYESASAVWKLYINGVLDVTKDIGSNITPANTSIQPAAIATAMNSTGVSDGYFSGNIDEARIWNVVRTDAEILNNYKLELTSGTGLAARYGLNEGSGTTTANSISSASNGTLVNNPEWSTGFEPPSTTVNTPPDAPANPSPANGAYSSPASTTLCTTVSDPENNSLRVRFFGRKKTAAPKFTIIMLPDTQFYTAQKNGGNNKMFKSQTSWIANNRALANISYVGQLGDCTDNADSYEVEWMRADTAIKTIENASLTGLTEGVPYGVSVGNHDQSPNGDVNGTTTFYNKYFGSTRFSGRSYYGGHFGTNNDNHYQLFGVSGIDFLVISLEYNTTTSFTAAGGALDWAESVVKSYPNRNVIVMSHYVLDINATFSSQGKAIYDRLKIYPNFVLMMGAHETVGGGEANPAYHFI